MRNNMYLRKMLAIALCIIMIVPLSGIVYATEASYLWPCPSTTALSRGYSSSHRGIDISASNGSNVVATKSGTVAVVYSGCKNYSGAASNGLGCDTKGCPNTNNYTYNGKTFAITDTETGLLLITGMVHILCMPI